MSSAKSELTTEFISYIQKQIQIPDIETYKILYSILGLYVFALCKIQRTKLDESYAIACADTLLYIFKTMYHYTRHAKVSLDMAERVVVIFEDCIFTSMSMNSLQIYISEIKEIIIEKTIGPLYLYKPTFTIDSTAQSSVSSGSGSGSGPSHKFLILTVDIMTSFLRNLFVKLIYLQRTKNLHVLQLQQSIQRSLFDSVSSVQSTKSVRSASEDAIDAYTINDELSLSDVSESNPNDRTGIELRDVGNTIEPIDGRGREYEVDVDMIEEQMMSIMIMMHIIVDKWVILDNGTHVEHMLMTTLEHINMLSELIPTMNNLKVRLECIYYSASLYDTVEEAFQKINLILDEYDEDLSDENEDSEWTTEYIPSNTVIKDYRPFQLRIYRIYEQKNK
jgi:hypothetical protein